MFQIFIGFVFVLFSIKLANIDLLADFMGFILIYIGLSNNLNKSYKFHFAKPLALVLSIISFFKFGFSIAEFITTTFKITSIAAIIDPNTVLTKSLVFIFDLSVVMLTYLILAGYKDIEKNEKVNLKLNTPFIIYIVNSISLILLDISVFFEEIIKSISTLEIIFTILVWVNSLVSLIFIIYMYSIFRNYNILIYNKSHKEEEWYKKVNK